VNANVTCQPLFSLAEWISLTVVTKIIVHTYTPIINYIIIIKGFSAFHTHTHTHNIPRVLLLLSNSVSKSIFPKSSSAIDRYGLGSLCTCCFPRLNTHRKATSIHNTSSPAFTCAMIFTPLELDAGALHNGAPNLHREGTAKNHVIVLPRLKICVCVSVCVRVCVCVCVCA